MAAQYIKDPSQLDNLEWNYLSRVGTDKNNYKTIYSLNFKLDGKDYTFIPSDVINKGFVADNTQYFFKDFLDKNKLDTLKTKGQVIDLNGVSWYGDTLKNNYGRDTTGVLIPTAETKGINFTPKQYEIGSGFEGNDSIKQTAITGLGQTSSGDYVYQNETSPGRLFDYIKADGKIYSQPIPSSSGGGFLGKVAKVIDKVAPVALAFVPGIGPALSAGYSAGSTLAKGGDLGDALKSGAISYGASTLGAKVGGQFGGTTGGTDYLGTQALGDATTGAVGSGATGFGINAGAAGVGINQGAGSLLGSTLTDTPSSFGISTTPPKSNFGEFSPYIGSGTEGASGIGIDTGAATEGYLGVGSATDAAAKSGLGYLGGAAALPTGTAGITTNVPAADSTLDKAKRLSDLLKSGQQQQSGFNPYQLVKGLTGGQQDMPIGYNMNQNPFTFTQQLPIQGSNAPMGTTPLDLSGQRNNLASLLRNL
jgi:hypothetical protein